MVDIGKLNRRITFLRLNTSEDEMGQDKSEWKKYRTVWATVKPYKASEYNFMSKLKPEVTHRMYILLPKRYYCRYEDFVSGTHVFHCRSAA